MSMLAHRDQLTLTETGVGARRALASTTDLEQVLSMIPWKDAFDFGVGVNAVTGDVEASAVTYSKVERRQVKSSDQSIHWVQSERELERTVATAVEGQYNIQVVNVGSRNKYLEDLELSALSMSLLATYSTEYEGYDEAQGVVLTTAAAERLLSDPVGFRAQYGDYFVSGARRRSSFIATYRCRARSIQELTEFKTAVGGGNGVFTAEGSLEFSKKAREHHIEVDVKVRMIGYKGKNPIVATRSDEVLKALAWFQKHEEGVRVRTLLRHYSQLAPEVSRSIDIPPQVFLDLQRLYLGVWKIRSLYRWCPERYQERFEERCNDLVGGVAGHRSQLPKDEGLRQRYYEAARALRHDLAKVFARQDFYFHVKPKRKNEPPQGVRTEPQDHGQVVWMYGYDRWSWGVGNLLEIQEKKLSWSAKWTPDVRHTFSFGPDSRYLIVGWKVISERADGLNGTWRMDSKTILLTDEGRVGVRNDFDRAINYSVNYYYVLADDYDFKGSR